MARRKVSVEDAEAKGEEAKRLLTVKQPDRSIIIDQDDFLSWGATLLDLACTGRVRGGLVKGHIYHFVGDSDSGKTFLSMTCFAEACRTPSFDDYDLILNEPEYGALMNVAGFFGQKVEDRLERISTRYTEEFFFDVDKRLQKKRPFLYVLDSEDGLIGLEEEKQFDERQVAFEGNKKQPGSYGTSRAKRNSNDLRIIQQRFKEHGSILIIINQTRMNIGNSFNPKTHSGGLALKFFSTIQLWSSRLGKINHRVRGQEREVGADCKIAVTKNRVSGRKRAVEIPIYHSFGIDDTGSCVDWLVEDAKHWEKWTENKKTIIEATEFDFEGEREDLIHLIEHEDRGRELRALTGTIWNDIEDELQLDRRPRYE